MARVQRNWLTWKKIACIALLLFAAAYIYSRPTLERWLDISLPAIVVHDPAAPVDGRGGPVGRGPADDGPVDDGPGNGGPGNGGPSDLIPADEPGAEEAVDPPSPTTQPSKQDPDEPPDELQSDRPGDAADSPPQGRDRSLVPDFTLIDLGNGERRSPAGLIYGLGPSGEDRMEQVMWHQRDRPEQLVHGVFTGDELQILQWIDEAYLMVLANSPRVQRESKDSSLGRVAYRVDLQRPIGYLGGRSGREQDFPTTPFLKLVLEGSHVITAFPAAPDTSQQLPP